MKAQRLRLRAKRFPQDMRTNSLLVLGYRNVCSPARPNARVALFVSSARRTVARQSR